MYKHEFIDAASEEINKIKNWLTTEGKIILKSRKNENISLGRNRLNRERKSKETYKRNEA